MVFMRTASTQAQISLAEQLYKYQNFKSSVIPSKVLSDSYQSSSIIAFHALLRKYLATGVKDLKRAIPEFYATIDELKSKCYSTLRPTEEEAARPYAHKPRTANKNKITVKRDKTITKPSVAENTVKISQDTLQKIKASNKETYVALRNDDQLRLFKNEDQMAGYLKAYEDNNLSISFEQVKVTIEKL